jgi:hypothetical protein
LGLWIAYIGYSFLFDCFFFFFLLNMFLVPIFMWVLTFSSYIFLLSGSLSPTTETEFYLQPVRKTIRGEDLPSIGRLRYMKGILPTKQSKTATASANHVSATFTPTSILLWKLTFNPNNSSNKTRIPHTTRILA